LPPRGTVLEIASGTGEHATFFATALPNLRWQPSDIEGESLASIAAWTQTERTPNVCAPLGLDVTEHPWPIPVVDAIFTANMIHIAAWSACLGLMRGAGAHLGGGGVLVVYGPFKIDGAHTAPSNAAFDLDLRRRNATWGVRDLADVIEAAHGQGLTFEERVGMPSNNQALVFRREARLG
jgi:hypothetical protein